MSQQPCIACHASTKNWLVNDNFRNTPLKVCVTCGHVQIATPPPNPEQIIQYYEGEYSKKRAVYVNETYMDIMKKRAKAQADYVRQFVPLEQAKMLDIGSGYGLLIKELSKYSKEVSGLEYDDRCITYTEQVLQQKVKKIYNETDLLDIENHDVVFMSHVLEHFMEADKVLSALKSKARFIFIEIPSYTPGINEQWEDLQGHTQFFSLANFKQFLQNQGLQILDIDGYGISQPFYWLKNRRRLRNWFCKYIFQDWFMQQYDRPNPNGIWLRALVATGR